jgi:uncharacterized protein (AIM24 family)
MERFSLQKLNEAEGKEQYQTETSNSIAAFGNVDYDVNMNRAWKTVIENRKTSAKNVYVIMN